MKVGEGFIKDRLVARDRQRIRPLGSASCPVGPCFVSRRLEVVSSRPGIVSRRLVSRSRHVNKRPPSLINTAPVRVAIRGVWRYAVTRGPRRISRGRKDQHAPSPTTCRRCRLSVDPDVLRRGCHGALVVMVTGQSPTEQELQQAVAQAKAEMEAEAAAHVVSGGAEPDEGPFSGALNALAREHRSTPMAKELSRRATVLEKVAKHFMSRRRTSSYTIAMLSAIDSPSVTSVCDDTSMEPITCPTPAVPEFRSANGRCNNRDHPLWGSSEEPFRRLLEPEYGDGMYVDAPSMTTSRFYLPFHWSGPWPDYITLLPALPLAPSLTTSCFYLPFHGQAPSLTIHHASTCPSIGLMIPRKTGRDGAPLPSARLVSTTMHEDLRKSSPVNTHMVMQFGQFLDHDITLTPNFQEEGLVCTCDSEDERCFNINIPSNDPDFSGRPCLQFARSLSGPNEGCHMGRRQQLNQLTAFVDASNVYGSSDKEIEELREHAEVNVAVSKTATQSSLFGSIYPPERAVDGNTGTILYPLQQCASTGLEYEPWWKVDLGDTYVISHVTVINRGDCCGERLRNFMVRVGPHENLRENTPCGDIYSETPSEGETIDVRCEEPITGRWVSVQLIGGRTTCLCVRYRCLQ
ncbi:hypothetical protein Bbelb_242790 [Branchiostoma belcheri]|nr:hypothetical protein Bbelb_242790 [Branchiostoma belcheri]